MIYKYIIPACKHMSELFEFSLKKYLQDEMQTFAIVFSFFMVFLLLSLVVSLNFVMKFLRILVFRNRILVKIIPDSELSYMRKQIFKKNNE